MTKTTDYTQLLGAFSANNIKTVVFTGGPCGGKSTILKMAKQLLESHGYRVFLIPEAARELIGAGFHPANQDWTSGTAFQQLILISSFQKEALYLQSALELCNRNDKPVVFLCDRGAMDGAAYVESRDVFSSILKEVGIDSISQVRDRYDLIVHLVTAANGAESFYVNDEERHENIEQACQIDKRLIEAWMGHSHHAIIDNGPDSFSGKISRALLALTRTLSIPMTKEIEAKFRVLNFEPGMIPSTATSRNICQTYLDRPDRPGIECRVRKSTHPDGFVIYHYTEKTPTDELGVRGEFEEEISEVRYNELVQTYALDGKPCVSKVRHKFEFQHKLLELDVYDGDLDGLVTIEVEVTSQDELERIELPSCFQVIDVTSDKRYSNRNLASHGIPT